MTIAGFGDTASSDGGTTGMFTGNKPQIGHQLLCRIEPGQVAKFGNSRGRNNQGNAAQSLQGFYQRSQLPLWHQFLNLSGKTLHPFSLLLDGMHIFLQSNLLCPVRHLDVGDPVLVSLGSSSIGRCNDVHDEAERPAAPGGPPVAP